MSVRRVICFGTFDIVHRGHVHFLTQAARYGTELFVVVSRDDRRAALTGRPPVHNQKERIAVVQALRVVTRAVAGHPTDILYHIKKIKPQVVVLGHDQKFGVDVLQTWASAQKMPVKIVRLKPFQRTRYATSHIKKRLCRTP